MAAGRRARSKHERVRRIGGDPRHAGAPRRQAVLARRSCRSSEARLDRWPQRCSSIVSDEPATKSYAATVAQGRRICRPDRWSVSATRRRAMLQTRHATMPSSSRSYRDPVGVGNPSKACRGPRCECHGLSTQFESMSAPEVRLQLRQGDRRRMCSHGAVRQPDAQPAPTSAMIRSEPRSAATLLSY